MRSGLGFLLAGCLSAASLPLAKNIDEIIANEPALRGAFVGVVITNLSTGAILHQIHADKRFVPASNTKLFTTALALVRLGPEYRFQTTLVADAPPQMGVLSGDLRLVGGGDPTWSNRILPYDRNKREGDALKAVEELADAVASAGITRVDGAIVGDDSAYIHEPYPEGWAAGDAVWEYGAPVSALIVNDNSALLSVRPSLEPGLPALLTLEPPLPRLLLHNQIRQMPGKENSVDLVRHWDENVLTVSGTLGQEGKGSNLRIALPEPALTAAQALEDALERRGIAIRDSARAQHRTAAGLDLKGPGQPLAPMETGFVVARRLSRPLHEIAQVVDKISQNLEAEILLREVGRAVRGLGSREAGLEAMKEFLTEIGVAPEEYSFQDGSGLTRSTVVTPNAVIRLLTFMNNGLHREVWRGLLPVGGVDGSLAVRFKDMPEAQRVLAKTGTLARSCALSGYATTAQGEPLAFSILVNNQVKSSTEVQRAVDKIVLMLVR